MQLKFITFKDRSDLVEGDKSNFINDLPALKSYIADQDVRFFVNIKGVHGCREKPFQTYKDAHIMCEKLLTDGYGRDELFISISKQQTVTADDIDC